MKSKLKVLAGLLAVVMGISAFPALSSTVRADGINIETTFDANSSLYYFAKWSADTDYDGYLSASEISDAEDIYLWYNDEITNSSMKGLEVFSNAKYFSLVATDASSSIKVTSLDLTCLSNLEVVWISDDVLTSLVIPQSVNQLTFTNCGNSIPLNLNDYPNVELLSFEGGTMTSFDTTAYPNIKYYFFSNTTLSSIVVGSQVSTLYVDGTNISNIDLSMAYNLEVLAVYNTPIATIDLSNCTQLWVLEAEKTNLTDINIAYNPVLKQVYNNPSNKLTQIEEWRWNEELGYDELVPVTIDYNLYEGVCDASNYGTLSYDFGTTITVTEPETGIAAFIERLYNAALNRGSDPDGKANWLNYIYSGGNAAHMARSFLLSPEFVNKSVTDSQFVDILYQTFFNRAADPAGKSTWLEVLGNGSWSRADVIEGFINTPEFATLCLSYGVASGIASTPNVTINPSVKVRQFSTRLYSTCLNRKPDEQGLLDWSFAIANGQFTATVAAHEFFFSPEFTNANISNVEFVNRLYRTFFNREGDPEGMNTWVTLLNNGASREYVFNGFADSAEWARLCNSAGIFK